MSDKRHFHHKKKVQDNYKPPFPEAVLAEPVTNLTLREDTVTLLTGANVNTIGDVLKRTETDFYKINRFNKKNLMDVKFAVKKRNLFLKPLPVPVANAEEGKADGQKKPAPAPQREGKNKQNGNEQKGQNKQNKSAAPQQQKQQPQQQKQQPQQGQKPNPQQNAGQKGQQKAEKAKQADSGYVMTTLVKRPPKPVKEEIKEEPDIYVKVNKGGLWGFKDRNSKNMPVPAVYDEVFSFKEDLCCVQKGEKFGFINRQGEEVIPPIYDCATSFSEGLACVYKSETCGYIDKKGETVIEFKFDAGTPVVNGECRVKKAGKWGELHVAEPSSIRWII